jgi:diguanylate cyclase (GGDEF)-like protein
MQYIKYRGQKHIGSVLKVFLLSSVVLSVLYTFIFFQFKKIEKQNVIENYREESAKHIDYLSSIIHSHFDLVISDLQFLTKNEEVLHWAGDNSSLAAVQNEFIAFSNARQIYDKIRLLDLSGRELLSVNFRNGTAAAYSNPEKTDTSFEKIREQNSVDIYMAPFDLAAGNNGSVELPLKPMIRFGLGIYNDQYRLQGAVMLNYSGENILSAIRNSSYHSVGSVSLYNREGYWLYSDNPEMNWGFMYAGRKNIRMPVMFPKEWQIISRTGGTQQLFGEKLISSVLISPLSEKYGGAPTEKWILEYSIPFKDMGISQSQIYRKYGKDSLIILPLLFLLSFIYAVVFTQRAQYKKTLKQTALYDALTKLPNRNLLFERIDRTIKLARRYSFIFAVLFIDLDGFKLVNDIYGHTAGDELLQQVGERLKDCTRKSDTVARYGGDEFIIILSRLTEKKDCERIAEKIIKRLSERFVLSMATVKIGASIGLTVGDQNFDYSIDSLITKADDAMYKAKNKGKNQYVFL